MWFCTTSLDQLLGSAVCWRGQRSFWSLSPAGLLRSSPPGPPPPQTATCPSDQPDRLPSSPARLVYSSPAAGLTLRQHKTSYRNMKFTVMLLRQLLTNQHLKLHKNPNRPSASQRPRTSSSQRERSPDLLTNTKMASPSQTRQSNAPGASSHRKEFCCRTLSHRPRGSITWCRSTGSTSTRGPNG